jgi:hypothetical protein
MEELSALEIARIKKAVFCIWLGFIYALGIYLLAGVGVWIALLVFLLIFISSYMNLARNLLVAVGAIFLFVILLALADFIPTGSELKTLAGQTGKMIRNWH